VDSSSRFGHAQDAAKSLVALRAAVAIAVYHGGRKANRVEVPCDYRLMNVRSHLVNAVHVQMTSIANADRHFSGLATNRS
jgi:hypothetical protein